MKLSLAFAAVALALWADPLLAAEGPGDVQTDHVDAYDEGGKPSVGVFANPGALLAGAISAELELALGDVAALGLEADAYAIGATRAYGAALGLPIFVERVRFHGLYVEPRVVAETASGAALSSSVVGAGATAGWEETWRFGLSLKGGIGLLWVTPLGGVGDDDLVVGVRPLVDASVGWVF